jgi:lambda family phage portal protein
MYDTIASIIAKSIALFAPGYANRYMQNHYALRSYTAAERDNSYRNYKPAQTTGAQEILQAWQPTTNATRELERNNSHVSGMKMRFIAALVGEGSWPRPKVLKAAPKNNYDFDIPTNTEILRRWERFAPTAGANGDSIYQLQRLAAAHFLIDGGILFRRVYINNEFGQKILAIEPIELDHLDTSKDTDTPELRIVGGKQLDKYNKVIGYWLKPRHPAETQTESVFVDAKDIIDLYDRQRASAVGGISRMAPTVMNFHNIGMYRADTMKLARTALGFGVFVESDDPGAFFNEDEDENDAGGNPYQYITPGGVHYLRKGEKINTVKPENPGTQYEPFLRSELRSASVGAGMSYESVSNDGSQTNYSSSRQMLLFERAMVRYTFAIFQEKFYDKVYRWFLEFEMDFGRPQRLVLPNYAEDPIKYLRVVWSRPKTEWVDPLKDAKAGKQEVDMGVNTLTDLCDTTGRDIEEVVATRKYEINLMKEAGIIDYIDTAKKTNASEEESEDSTTEESEEIQNF